MIWLDKTNTTRLQVFFLALEAHMIGMCPLWTLSQGGIVNHIATLSNNAMIVHSGSPQRLLTLLSTIWSVLKGCQTRNPIFHHQSFTGHRNMEVSQPHYSIYPHERSSPMPGTNKISQRDPQTTAFLFPKITIKQSMTSTCAFFSWLWITSNICTSDKKITPSTGVIVCNNKPF